MNLYLLDSKDFDEPIIFIVKTTNSTIPPPIEIYEIQMMMKVINFSVSVNNLEMTGGHDEDFTEIDHRVMLNIV